MALVLRRIFLLVCMISGACCVALGLMSRRQVAAMTPLAPSTDFMQETLSHVLPQVSFNGVPLRDALEFVRDVGGPGPITGGGRTGMHPSNYTPPPPPPPWAIDINWGAIQKSEISPDVPVTHSWRNVPHGLLLVELAASGGLSCRADASLVHISTVEDLRHPRQIPRPAILGWRSQRDRAAEAALDVPIPEVENGTSTVRLHEALQSFSDFTKLKIRVDWPALEASGLRGTSPCTLGVRSATTRQVLELTLRNAGPSSAVQFKLQDGDVVISPRDRFDAEERPVRLIVLVVAISAALLVLRIALYRVQRRGIGSLRRAIAGTAIVVTGLLGVLLVVAAWCSRNPAELVLLSRRITVGAERGMLRVWLTPADPLAPYWERRSQFVSGAGPAVDTTGKQICNVWRVRVIRHGWPFNSWTIAAPFWVPITATALLPGIGAMLAVTRVAARRRKRGLCRQCGYDLRASVGRCPECGTAIP